MLTGPPETHYHPTVTEVAFRVRALPVGPVAGTPLYINPSVARHCVVATAAAVYGLLSRWRRRHGILLLRRKVILLDRQADQ